MGHDVLGYGICLFLASGQQLIPFTSKRYNRDIKTMFEKVGLDRIVTVINPKTREEEKKRLCDIASSHLARRTFIGNLYKETPDPNIIGKLSGHKEGSRAFARYRDIDDDMLTDLVSKLNRKRLVRNLLH